MLHTYTRARATQGPVNVTSLVAHLLYFATHGTRYATALPDTFGTAAFVAVAAAADVPPLFAFHLADAHGEVVRPGSKCFDLFRWVWVGAGEAGGHMHWLL